MAAVTLEALRQAGHAQEALSLLLIPALKHAEME